MEHAGKALIDPEIIFSKINLGAGMHVADLGCGRTGHFVFPAARIVGDKGLVYAVDVIKDILASIESRVRAGGFNNIQTVWSDLEVPAGTPIPQATLNVACIVNVLFLSRTPDRILAEARRLLKKDGLLVIVDWQKQIGQVGPSTTQMVPADKVVRMAKPLGFAVVEQFSLSEYHYCLILKAIDIL